MKDEQFRKWEDVEATIEDDLHKHFQDVFDRWDWCEISEEARRVNNLMFNEEVDTNSAKDALFAAEAAQASHGAFASVAAMLDLDFDILESVCADWYDNQDKLPQAISFERFMKLYEKSKDAICNQH